MNKPKKLHIGDKVAIVSLSSGILGESFIKHELELGVKRLKELGLVPIFMDNSLKGIDFIANNPEKRADDLKQAFADENIKMVLCAIGGTDTILTLPYLLNDENFKNNVKNNPKIFMGFSDSTVNHLMLHKLGLDTFYGPAFITDFAEFEEEMLPYTKNAVDYLFNPTNNYEIKSSPIWYEDRKDFSPAAVGTNRVYHKETKGYELLQGKGKISGKLLGGCLDVLSDLCSNNSNESDEKILKRQQINKEFNIFPSNEDWKGKIMFIETSEEKMTPEKYRNNIQNLIKLKVFDQIVGLIVGKPIDEVYYEEYKSILKEELSDYNFPILFNLNFGHSYPRMVLPYGATAEIDADAKTLTLLDTTIE